MAELLFDTIFMDVNVVLVQLYSDYVRLHKVTTSLKKLVKESLLLKYCTDCKTFLKAILRFVNSYLHPRKYPPSLLKKNPGSVPDVHEYKAKYYIIWYSIN